MFEKLELSELQMNPFDEIGQHWLLISAKKEGVINTMTASWGQVGHLWGKNVATVYIRPQRYTKEFVDAGDYFTITFFDGYSNGRHVPIRAVSGSSDIGSVSIRLPSDSRPIRADQVRTFH